jgi:hypothetical protein
MASYRSVGIPDARFQTSLNDGRALAVTVNARTTKVQSAAMTSEQKSVLRSKKRAEIH